MLSLLWNHTLKPVNKNVLLQHYGICFRALMFNLASFCLCLCVHRDILRVGVTLAGHQKKILNSVQMMRAQMNQIQSVEVWPRAPIRLGGRTRGGGGGPTWRDGATTADPKPDFPSGPPRISTCPLLRNTLVLHLCHLNPPLTPRHPNGLDSGKPRLENMVTTPDRLALASTNHRMTLQSASNRLRPLFSFYFLSSFIIFCF